MKRNLLLCCLLGLAAGCATQGPEIATHYGDISGLRTDIMSDNLLETAGPPREVVWLNASRVWTSQDSAEYYLEVNYMARSDAGYLAIPPGETLTVVVDGAPLTFNGSGSAGLRKPYQAEFVKENAIYPASRSQLQKIAMARAVKVRVKGNNGLVERDFGPANFEKFRTFVTRFAF